MEKTIVTFTAVSEEGIFVSVENEEKMFKASLADGFTFGAVRAAVLASIVKIVFTGHYLETPQSVSLITSFDYGISEVHQPQKNVVSFEGLNPNYYLQIAGSNLMQLDGPSFYRALSLINSVSASIVANDPGDDEVPSFDPEEWQ